MRKIRLPKDTCPRPVAGSLLAKVIACLIMLVQRQHSQF